MNNLRISCNYPLVHIAHMTERGEERRTRNIASEVNEDNAKVQKKQKRCTRGKIEAISILKDMQTCAAASCISLSLTAVIVEVIYQQIRILHIAFTSRFV